MINGFTHERASQISVCITSNPATKDMKLCAYERLDHWNNFTIVQPAFVFSFQACHSMGFSFKFKIDIIKLSTRAISIPIKGWFICSPFPSMAYAGWLTCRQTSTSTKWNRRDVTGIIVRELGYWYMLYIYYICYTIL